MSINDLASRYPYFNTSEISTFQQQFSDFDKANTGKIHPRDMASMATKAGESYPGLTAKLAQMNLSDDNGNVGFEDFLQAVSALRQEKGAKKATEGRTVLHGHNSENILHTINEDEKESFVQHINQELANDEHLQKRIPIDKTSMQLFSECKDGLILAKLINSSVPGTIDERVINLSGITLFQMTENGNVVINSAKAIGCSVVNIGASDIIDGREHLILGLIWQIIKIGLQAQINIVVHPELFRLLEPGESLESFLKLPPEQILLRWFNYHLKKAGWSRQVKNFGSDIKVSSFSDDLGW
jgi:plastin-1